MILVDSAVAIPTAALKRASVGAVGRYLPNGVNGATCLTRGEVDDLHGAGIDVWLIWERLNNASLNGEGQGAADASDALKATHDLGAPPAVGIFFASDFDPGDPPAPSILAYYRATAVVRDAALRNGAYAGQGVLNACLAARTIDLPWATGASSWDHGQVCTQKVLQQEAGGPTIDGVSTDADLAYHSALSIDFGQWPAKPQPEGDDLQPYMVIQPLPKKDPVTGATNEAVVPSWFARCPVPNAVCQAFLVERCGAVLAPGVKAVSVPAPVACPPELTHLFWTPLAQG